MTNRKTRPRKIDEHITLIVTALAVIPTESCSRPQVGPGPSSRPIIAFPSLLGNDNEDLPLIRTLAAVAQLITRPQFPCAGTVEENSTL